MRLVHLLLKCLLLSGCIACLPTVVVAKNDSVPAAQFAAGVAAYQAEDYTAAHAAFSALASDHVSPELFANTGSAAYRIGNVGEAALWYKRALVLDSRQSEAMQNLRFLKRRLGFLNFEQGPMQQYARFLRRPVWRFGCALCGGLASICLVAVGCLRLPATVRNRLIGTAAFAVVLAGITGVGWWAKGSQRPLLARYVVTAPDVTALVAPNDSAARVVVLPQGTDLTFLEKRGAWIYANIPGGSRGWIRASQAEPLWPFSVRLAE